MKMNKRKFLSFFLSAGMVLLTACGGQTSTTSNAPKEGGGAGETAETIKVGVVTSLSGAYAVIGNDVVEGIQFAADEINEKGGLLGKKIEVLKEDDEGKPDIGLRKAEKIVTKDGANFILGSVSSAVGLAIGAKMPEWNAIYIATVNKTPKLTTTNLNDHIFRAVQNDLQDMQTIRKWYERDLKGNSWYMIGADYEWGHSSLAEFKKIAEANGDKVLGEAFTPLGTTDYSSQITNILNAKPDGVWVALSGSDGINFVKQAKSFGLADKVKIVTFITDPVINAVKADAHGVLGVVNYHHSLENENNKTFVANFERKWGKKPSNYHAAAYMGAQMLFKAIEKAGSAETKQVIQAMENLTFDSPLGQVTMNPQDHQLQLPNFIQEVVAENSEITMKMIYSESIKGQ